jgi:hypothetical protein
MRNHLDDVGRWCLLTICVLAISPVARAQDAASAEAPTEQGTASAAPAPAGSAPALDPEEAAALDAALKADASAAPTAGGATSDPGVPSAGRSGTQSMNPDLSVIADVAGAYFSTDDNLQGGDHDPTKTGFNLQQLELSISSVVDPYFRLDANLVFAPDGVEIEEVYATTLDLPWRLQARAGQFLNRFGRLNSTHPHAWDFVDQPFAITRVFGGEGNRGLGVELSWLLPLSWYVELVGSTTDAEGEGTSRSFLGAEERTVNSLGDFEHMLALKQFFPLSDDWSLAWGLSGAFGPNPTGPDQHSQVYGTDLYLKWRPISYQSSQIVSLHAEWIYRRRQTPDGVLQDTEGFAALMWRFAARWAIAARYEYGSPAVDTDFDRSPDYLDPEWTGARHRVAANGTFWPTEFSRIRLQASVDAPEWQRDPTFALFLALEVVAGAHGAHAF